MENTTSRLRVLLAALALCAIACFSDHGALNAVDQSGAVDHSIVLDTSSPDEPKLPAPGVISTQSVSSTSGLFLHASDSNTVMANRTYHGTSYVGPIVVSAGAEKLTNIEYRRWQITCDIVAGQRSRWGMITYNEVGCRYVGVRIIGINGEHALYQHNPQGPVTLTDCYFYDIAAQGYQGVSRGGETAYPLGWQNVGVHRFERCQFLKCGQPRGYGRASYAVSEFGRQAVDGKSPREFWNCPVELIDCVIEHDSQGLYELRGALLVEWRPSLLVQGGRTNYVGTSDRDLWHIHNVTIVHVENSYIHGPVGKYVDIDGADTVDFTSPNFNGGDAPVRINGVKMGTTDDEIHWHK